MIGCKSLTDTTVAPSADPLLCVCEHLSEAVVYGPVMRLSSVGGPKTMLDVPINTVVADKDPPVERPA